MKVLQSPLGTPLGDSQPISPEATKPADRSFFYLLFPYSDGNVKRMGRRSCTGQKKSCSLIRASGRRAGFPGLTSPQG